MSFLLGVDVGTTSIKAALYDSQQALIVALASRPTPTAHPRPGWTEHDPQAVWQATASAIAETLALAPHARPAALAVASMGEAGVLLDAQGQPLAPIIAYHDLRSAAYVDWWLQRASMQSIHQITGQTLRPVFGVQKLLWLRDQQPALFAQGRCWLSVGDWLVYQLAGVAATDYSLASRVMLFDQQHRDWSQALLELAGLQRDLLPAAYPAGTRVGEVTPAAAAVCGLAPGTPVVLGGHDHLCGALAAGAVDQGKPLASFGTAAALLAPQTEYLATELPLDFSCYAHVVPQRYIVQGGLSAAGGALTWLAQVCGADYRLLLDEAALSPPGARGLLCLPNLRGSGTPHRDDSARGAFLGLRDLHSRGDLARAVLESIACWARENLALVAPAAPSLRLIGGLARHPLFPQLVADVCEHPVVLPPLTEATAVGAALLAGLGGGVFGSVEHALMGLQVGAVSVAPDTTRSQLYRRLYHEAYLPAAQQIAPISRALAVLEVDAARVDTV